MTSIKPPNRVKESAYKILSWIAEEQRKLSDESSEYRALADYYQTISEFVESEIEL